jgi:(S)-2-hydroxyglutarate dehydrogenase
VPNLKNPFLGVHYTVTVDGSIKIGPTAIPAFWRQNYVGLDNFSFGELFEIIGWESRLFLGDNFGFRSLAFEELKKYDRSLLYRACGEDGEADRYRLVSTSGASRVSVPSC